MFTKASIFTLKNNIIDPWEHQILQKHQFLQRKKRHNRPWGTPNLTKTPIFTMEKQHKLHFSTP